MIEHAHGHVADDGTVFVRRPDGTHAAVGQWAAAGDLEQGLAFFERKYEGLRAEADLLLARLKDGKGSPESVAILLAKLREQVDTPHVVGDLAALSAKADEIEQAAAQRQAAAAAARGP